MGVGAEATVAVGLMVMGVGAGAVVFTTGDVDTVDTATGAAVAV